MYASHSPASLPIVRARDQLPDDLHRRDANNDLRWAVVRLVLGIGQMVGAATAVLLMISGGFSELALGAVVVTCVLTTISIVLFGSRRPPTT